MIPDSFKQDLLNRVDIVEVVSRHVPLKKSGANYLGLCPFHSEKTPSFTVSPAKQFYHCFGCGAHGNAIGFLMAYSSLGYVEAVKALADSAGMKMPEWQPRSADAAARRQRETDLLPVMERAMEFYRAELRKSPRAIAYLKGRGVSGEIAARYRIGYAPADWQALRAAFADYDDRALVAAGLVVESEGRRYDRFRDRVMFPIHNLRGAVVGFGGRVLGEGEPKYLNSPETPLFEKGREVYGLALAREAIRTTGRVIVVEGYMDVIGLARAGIDHALAPLGTAITTEQLEQLWRLAAEPVLCLDGDAAGLRAAERAAELALPLLGPGRSLRFVLLPEGEDPDSLVQRQGGDALRAALERPLSLVDFLWRQGVLGRALDTPERRAAAERELLARVQTIRNGAVRAHYRQELRERLRALWAPVRRAWAARPAVVAPAGAALARGLAAAADRAEAALLEVFLLTPSLLAELEEELAAIPLLRPEHDRMRAEILAWYAAAPTLDAAALRTHLSAHGLGPLIEHILRLRERARAVSRGDADEDVVGAWRSAAARHSRSVARMSGGSTSDEDRADERQAEVIARIGMLNRWLDRADRARVGPAAGETETVCGALGAPAADDGA